MVFRYYKASLKKNFGHAAFPLLFMIPILILIFVNLISAGNFYQQYRFHKNSNFAIMAGSIYSYDHSFFPVAYPMAAQYMEELSTKDSPFYNGGTTPMIYFCKNAEALEVSYFTEKNLIAGELPNANNFQELQDDGRFPICISYDSAREADSWVGDELDILLSDGAEQNITLHFQITGILYPDGNKGRTNSDGNQLPPLACALTDEQTYDRLPELLGFEKLYCNFFAGEKVLNGQTYSVTMEEMLETIRSEIDVVQLAVILVTSGLIVIVLSCISYSLLKLKIKRDTGILRIMGMHPGSVLSIHFLRSASALFAAVLLSTLFIQFVYLPLILGKYFDFLFIGAIGLAELLLGLGTCSVMAFVLRRK